MTHFRSNPCLLAGHCSVLFDQRLLLLLLLQVVAMSLVFCAMLEDSHSISLSSVFSTELWPSIDSEQGLCSGWTNRAC
jgi:hypothetical protein